MRLAQLALERNVRSVLLDLSTGYHAATWHAILPALRKSGYKLGVHLPPAATLDGACDFATTERMSQAAFLDAAASTLAVPASRTLIVHPNAGEHIAMVGLDTSTAVPFPTPDTLVQDLLGFQHCLDPLYRAFGPYPIRFSEVFYESAHSVALVNLKPIVPGTTTSVIIHTAIALP
ncbi:hypothetical protein SDRG_06238 [Saprolegnia diclina VS20]|uniref:Uncharacterized protein n=1 Tax=Saprolegnia diclina (strain VS20) TaxID=1156394 RepID=T0S0G1_SAPDV|nr:hypothetical protein SDRG_06238 [Saprolegnia diclina VS20]EQC36122.1 hypothetical protein SDRG_06238 [Saprolegnia diclina VS20]|eukprot:XP_008610228.1 hypothetical protein SDRG_06238 [Saprolegnia diclina VS20]